MCQNPSKSITTFVDIVVGLDVELGVIFSNIRQKRSELERILDINGIHYYCCYFSFNFSGFPLGFFLVLVWKMFCLTYFIESFSISTVDAISFVEFMARLLLCNLFVTFFECGSVKMCLVAFWLVALCFPSTLILSSECNGVGHCIPVVTVCVTLQKLGHSL